MPDGETLLLFLAAALALNLTPGPDMLYVAALSGAEGRSAGAARAGKRARRSGAQPGLDDVEKV